MRCLSPLTVSFKDDGKTISWSQKTHSKEFSKFQIPCSKCIPCRLEQARSKAIRCMHEAQMYEKNSFITLTYSDEHLKSPKLQYYDFQLFVKKLRNLRFEQILKQHALTRDTYKLLSRDERRVILEPGYIPLIVTGEYGDKTKRPHWHALLFNYEPSDLKFFRTTELDHVVSKSEELNNLWQKGHTETGSVTLESAGYVCRYAAKKLIHGKDQDHDFHPIHKMSSKHAIGKKFLECYWQDIFNYGRVVLKTGQQMPIPRYYEKWLLKTHPDAYHRYVTQLKSERNFQSEKKQTQKEKEQIEHNIDRYYQNKPLAITETETLKVLMDDRFKRLQKHLKGDF